jgi:dihydropyrimidinase
VATILIRGGTVVSASGESRADVFVEDGVIASVGLHQGLRCDRVVDATGMFVLPGGIDVHTHLDMEFGDTRTCDDFTSGTAAAAAGGTTTIIDFCLQKPGESFEEALQRYFRKMETAPPVVDVGLHIAITDLREGGTVEDLATLPGKGVTSYKLFMAYKGGVMVDDETLFRSMQVATATGALVMVHAENGDAIDVLVRQALADGHTEPVWHARTRPPETEAEATFRAIQLARLAGCPLYVVHVSCDQAIAPIARARAAGHEVWGETCPQYLLFDETVLEADDFGGARYVYTPPPRPSTQHDPLWRALRTDVLSVVSTDHAPFNWQGQKTLGLNDFSQIPNGGPGIENRLEVLYTFGVGAGRLSNSRFVELVATAPARLFGLYPRKGAILPGSDADIVVWDPNRTRTITGKTQYSRVDYSLYEGIEVTGSAHTVLLRGEAVVENGEVCGEPGVGTFVPRARFGKRLEPVRESPPAMSGVG